MGMILGISPVTGETKKLRFTEENGQNQVTKILAVLQNVDIRKSDRVHVNCSCLPCQSGPVRDDFNANYTSGTVVDQRGLDFSWLVISYQVQGQL